MSKGTKGMKKDVSMGTMSKGRFEMIWPGDVVASPYQTRRRFEGIEELAESIRAVGLMNPIVVRARPGFGGYELIAGERRWRAFELAFGEGMDVRIPAMVVEVDDRTAAELVVTENMQREQLGPLEEAAGVEALLKLGHSAEEVGERLGRTGKWVRRRAKLLELAPEIKEMLGADAGDEGREDRESVVRWQALPLAALELIAALPVKMQVEEFVVGHSWSPMRADVQRVIERRLLDLAVAPFCVVGECEGCTKRTGAEPDLFEGVVAGRLGRCLDKGCWERKEVEAVRAKVYAARRDNPGAMVVAGDWEVEEAMRGVEEGLDKEEDWDEAEEGDEGAVEAVEVYADGRVNKIWVVVIEDEGDEGGESGKDVDEVDEAEETERAAQQAWLRRQKVAELKKFNKWLWEKGSLEGALERAVEGLDEGARMRYMVRVMLTLGVQRCGWAMNHRSEDAPEGVAGGTDAVWYGVKRVIEDGRVCEAVASGIKDVIRSRLKYGREPWEVDGAYADGLRVDRLILGANVMEVVGDE